MRSSFRLLPHGRSGWTLLECLLILSIILVLIALAFPLIQFPFVRSYVHGATRLDMCKNNLKQIGLALWNYHDEHGCFPPPVVTDEHGNPAHSWRVLILPFLDQQPLYDQHRFDEPWNGPNNSKLLPQCPNAYQCPSMETEEPNTLTRYLAVTRNDGSFIFDSLQSGFSDVIAVVDAKGREIPWSQPGDITVLEFSQWLKDAQRDEKQFTHGKVTAVLMSDGTTRRIVPETVADEFKKLPTEQ